MRVSSKTNIVDIERLFAISKKLYKKLVRRLLAGKDKAQLCEHNMSYDWEKEKLSDSQLSSYFQDIEYCSKLKQKTVICDVCGLRLKLDTSVPGVRYCTCSGKQQQSGTKGEGWQPYVERADLLVWRREHASKRGLYEYKLYGQFDDVTVWEFLAVQLDMSQYRSSWDTSTAQCHQVETEDTGATDTGTTAACASTSPTPGATWWCPPAPRTTPRCL